MSQDLDQIVDPEEFDGADRVRQHTAPERVGEIDSETHRRVAAYVGASDGELSGRIAELDGESDIERALEVNAAALALVGLGAGVFLHRRFLVLPAIVVAFLLQHGIQGWCPPIPVFRRLGVRTRQEIDAEKYALKALRGDFDRLREQVS